ncbi:immunoglobulin superfamily member 6 isoform X2 [Antennarius striatus]|uniref:immunoglobulin superfamily member 6 isoform X2 n=1 Tax=Antennarius striatus TaxID=241820 RepID=UPI0035ADFBC9
MKLLFWFSLLLIDLTVTENMETVDGCLKQQNNMWGAPGQSATLRCDTRSHCSNKSWSYEWIAVKEHHQFRIKPSEKYKLNGAFLHISALNRNDSGIYFCAAVAEGFPAPGLQQVGFGTILTVKERFTLMRIIRLLAFILLSIYSVALVTLIVKKYGCRRIHKLDKNHSSKKKQFQHVLQEMYRRGNQEKPKQTATNTNPISSSGDIYQNI